MRWSLNLSDFIAEFVNNSKVKGSLKYSSKKKTPDNEEESI